MLPFGDDAKGVAHVAADKILEKAVTVESAAILPDLHEPVPNRFGRRINIDGVGDHGGGVGRERVAREDGDAIEMRGAPM